MFCSISAALTTTFILRVHLVLQGLAVELVLAQATAHSVQVGHVARQLLDRLDLLGEVVRLEEVAHVRIVVLAGHGVQVEQRLSKE